ncbi:MAG TPA: EamA family transporter [Bacteroidia bacterium]|nr:EamA family transporter [Bacteroidia bacterium]
MISLALIWGSSFILMKRGLLDFTADQVASIRMFASFLCLFPFVIRHTKKIKKEQWKYIFATGLLGNGIPAFLFTTAQTEVPSFMAGMLNSLTPLFTLIIGYFVFKSQISFNKIAGVGLGLAGAVGLIMINAGSHIGDVSFYPMLIVIATLCYACSVNIIKHKLQDVESILISGFALFIVGPPTGIYLFTTNFVEVLTDHSHAWISLIYVLLLAIFGTAISIVLFNKLIKSSGALFASSVTYLIPIVAMLWGLVDNEKLGIFHLFALGAILGGVYLINRKPKPLQDEN